MYKRKELLHLSFLQLAAYFLVTITLTNFSWGKPQEFFFQQNYNLVSATDSIIVDTCDCSPSLPLEVAVSSIAWGLPSYFITRTYIHPDTSSSFNASSVLILPSLFLLMYSLGPTAELTSGCEASYWHLTWIGLSTQLPTFLIYAALKGKDPAEINKFRIDEYLVLGVLPAIASTIIYNTFLDCPKGEDTNTDAGEVLLPIVNPKYLGLHYQHRF